MKSLIPFVCFLLLFSGCATEQYYYDMDSSADFNAYKTFAWYAHQPETYKNPGFDNQILESNIKNYTSGELKRRGFKVDLDSPDVVFDYTLMIEKKNRQEQQPIYAHPYNYGYYNPYRPLQDPYSYPNYITGYQTVNIPYNEGTLIINMIDHRTNRLVWRGWSVATVTDEMTYESELHLDIMKIMQKFPRQISPR
jgi:hypothetical protein